ncbi:DUF7344 domain-containing protein [Halostella salina]|uniref:DUF7344 domain-containing protein n=1 Tax=Halostella salina TaxID=1547897 RepID=UPI000EF84950|nr:hypothetical protein [Halostella salina]
MVETDSPRRITRTAGDGDDIRLNAVFDALADERRRRVLRCLRDDDPPVPVESIARSLRDEVGDDERTLEASLHHRDLPRLDDSGVISYDRETNCVVDCDRIDAVQPYLDTALRMER